MNFRKFLQVKVEQLISQNLGGQGSQRKKWVKKSKRRKGGDRERESKREKEVKLEKYRRTMLGE